MTETSPTRNRWLSIAVLCGFIALTMGRLELGSWVTRTSVNDWYGALHKPWFTPPNVVFNPVWATLYVLMAIAAWLVWRHSPSKLARGALIAFAVQLTLNLVWSVLFFGMKRIDLALLELVALWVTVIDTQLRFKAVDGLAGLMFLPYTVWVGFALLLNAGIFWLN